MATTDGDTITVRNDDFQRVKVRLAEIDAPQRRQAFGTRSRQSLGELCHEKRTEVRVIDVERYGRVIGRVSCVGVDANAARMRRGMAWVYNRYATDKTFYRLRVAARSAGRELWADQHPVVPRDWRKRSCPPETPGETAVMRACYAREINHSGATPPRNP
ncbi:thermonuclease family protein [Aromatoleum diolicum]|uniref:thermonuclease family protein n=1 Tax=Aromatoleum diolicum TaxID=75796 RepID=UPI001B7D2A3E